MSIQVCDTPNQASNIIYERALNLEQPAFWGGVFAMTLCIFSLVSSEFMPVGLLTPLAADLSISEGLAGQGIAISGMFGVLTSLSISALAGGINRKIPLLTMTSLMLLSALIIALSPNYVTYMTGRAFLGVAIGGFWSMSAATAIRLVPKDQLPRALAIFNGGNALAIVVAAPLGSYIGSLLGWRGAFFCLIPVSLIALIWQWRSLPDLHPEAHTQTVTNPFKLFKNQLVTLGMSAVGIFFMGQFALYTYVRPYLEAATHISSTMLSIALLTIGLAGFVGASLVGSIVQKIGVYQTLIAIPFLLSIIALLLITFSDALIPVMVLLGLWGFVATAAPVVWWMWLTNTIPDSAEVGGGLMVAVIQLAIALGSILGGILFDLSGYQSTFMLSAVLLVIAAFLALLSLRKANLYGKNN